jgi:hypothetical protein
MDFATEMYVRSLVSRPKAQHVRNLIDCELDQGFTIVLRAVWLEASDWKVAVISQDGKRIRLVLLDATHPGSGAFTRLVRGIWAAGLTPVLVEPSQSLIDWAVRHGFRRRTVGKGHLKHHIWHPTGRS